MSYIPIYFWDRLLIMLLRTNGGNTYTEADFRSWLAEAGLGDVQIDDVVNQERQLLTAIRQ